MVYQFNKIFLKGQPLIRVKMWDRGEENAEDLEKGVEANL